MQRAIRAVGFLLVLICLVASSSTGQARKEKWRTGRLLPLSIVGSASRIAPLTGRALLSIRAHSSGGKDTDVTITKEGGGEYLICNVEFETAAKRERFHVDGATVFSHFDKWADMFISPSSGEKVEAALKSPDSGVVWVDSVGRALVPPPANVKKVPKNRGGTEAIVRGGIEGVTGKGIIIAIVDSGVDFRHPDFIAKDSSGRPVSRLLYLWDTMSNDFDAHRLGSKPPLSYPNGASVGTLYTWEQLTAALGGDYPPIPATDERGHGTACAGIAAGNGKGTSDERYTGVAPEADIIGVKIGGVDNIPNGYLLNAITAWVDDIAGLRPAVMSCSYGGQYGSHDGFTIEERQLDGRFAPQVKSRAICIAAGNEGDLPFHSEAILDAEKPRLFAWEAEGKAVVRLIFATSGKDDVSMEKVEGTNISDAIAHVSPFTHHLTVEVVSNGPGAIRVTGHSGKQIKCDGYISGGIFDKDTACSGKQIGVPGTSANAITVGSYDFNDIFDLKEHGTVAISRGVPMILGALSYYSSPGPSRFEGIIKPDIAAPGQWYTASYGHRPDGKGLRPLFRMSGENMVDATGNYQLMNGTSAATPYVAGVVALMLQKKPTLTAGEIKELLHRYANHDEHTGSTPNAQWGYGKLNMSAIVEILKAIR